ncbi:MAG: hypothetical protein LBC35_06375 [Coriobacteriales bacterium]|jgi:hypothetical protein|nr:hypothetical protein [Coriobacteriales bacterium]
MKLKRSLAYGLFFTFFVLSLWALPAVAFAAVVGDVNAQETMSFDPLIYVTAVITVCMLCSVAVALVASKRMRDQQQLICNNYRCTNNPQAKLDCEGTFDYRDFETPNEFTTQHHSEQISCQQLQQPAIQQLTQAQPLQAILTHPASHQVIQTQTIHAQTSPAQPFYGQAPFEQAHPGNTGDFTLEMIKQVIERHQITHNNINSVTPHSKEIQGYANGAHFRCDSDPSSAQPVIQLVPHRAHARSRNEQVQLLGEETSQQRKIS